MTFIRTSLILVVALCAVAFTHGDAHAQAAHDTSLLTKEERTHYAKRLGGASDSAGRAKIKAEMNRLIQTRRLEQRKKQSVHKSGKSPSGPQR